ncbi:hypothetical protein OKW27_000171 [Paraburkholderia sp. 35.1]
MQTTVRRYLGSNFGLLCHLKGIVDLDATVPHCACTFGMAEDLNGAEVVLGQPGGRSTHLLSRR